MVKSFYSLNQFYHFKESVGFYVELDQQIIEVSVDVELDSSKQEIKVQLFTGFSSRSYHFFFFIKTKKHGSWCEAILFNNGKTEKI